MVLIRVAVVVAAAAARMETAEWEADASSYVDAFVAASRHHAELLVAVVVVVVGATIHLAVAFAVPAVVEAAFPTRSQKRVCLLDQPIEEMSCCMLFA